MLENAGERGGLSPPRRAVLLRMLGLISAQTINGLLL